MALFTHPTKDEWKAKGFTHKGWVLKCIPVYTTGTQEHCDLAVRTRNWVPEPLLGAAVWLWDVFQDMTCPYELLLDAPPLYITGEIE